MRALTPAAPRTQRVRPLRSIRWPSGHPIPNHVVRLNVTFPRHPRAFSRLLAEPGFAWKTPRRLATARRRIGFVFLQAVHSPPAASHPASKRREPRPPLGRRSCFQLHMRWLHMVRTPTVLTRRT